MVIIGKGAFTKAYKKGNTVILESVDPIKECMALGYFPVSKLIPKIRRISYGEVSTYKMKYYPKVTKPKQQLSIYYYNVYKELRKINGLCVRDKDYQKTIENLNISNSIKNVILYSMEASMNYSDNVVFEISPRNISTTNTKQLVLMDCFFCRNKLMEVRGWN